MVFWDSLPEPGHLPRILSWHFLCTAHWQTAPNKVHRRPTQKSNENKNKNKENQKIQENIYFQNELNFFSQRSESKSLVVHFNVEYTQILEQTQINRFDFRFAIGLHLLHCQIENLIGTDREEGQKMTSRLMWEMKKSMVQSQR